MKTFVCGDIHGAHKALKQCLERSGFDYENDLLIQLGDIADGWSEVYETVEELLKIKNLIKLRGNHDDWFIDFIEMGTHPAKWSQGGLGTLKSYIKFTDKIIRPTMSGLVTSLMFEDLPLTHVNFFLEQKLYYIDDKNRFFVHAGFNRDILVQEEKDSSIFYWDRKFWNTALSFEATFRNHNPQPKMNTANDFEEVFIGHTTTRKWNKDIPMKAGLVWNLDTGCGFDGKLTIMDIDTKEYWQSDNVKELYPNEQGR